MKLTLVGIILVMLSVGTYFGLRPKGTASVARSGLLPVKASAVSNTTGSEACGCGSEAETPATQASQGEESCGEGCSEPESCQPQSEQACGPVALYAALTSLGAKTSLDELTRLTAPEKGQTSMLDLAKTARAKGFKATGMRITYEELQALSKPAVAWLREGHFVAVLECHNSAVTLGGASGTKPGRTTKEDFQRHWTGEVLVIEKP